MIARLSFGVAIVGLALIMGCGTAPPEVNELADGVNELRTGLRESEERQQRAVRKLEDEIKELRNDFKLLEERAAAKAAKTETQLGDFQIQQRNFDAKLDKVNEQLNKLPIEMKLQMRVPRRIEGTLEEALAELSHWTMIPIRFEASDLGEAGIPKIHYVELAGGDAPASKLLGDALRQTNLHPVSSLADPQLNIVYVIQNAGDLGHESLLITTRKRAAQRGKLPDEFAIKK